MTGASFISADTLREQKIKWDKEQKAVWLALLFQRNFEQFLPLFISFQKYIKMLNIANILFMRIFELIIRVGM